MTESTPEERFLVTGAHGCVGAWTIRQLVDEGAFVVALDVSDDQHRLDLVLDGEELSRMRRSRADITDLDLLERTLEEHRITNVIHLAALQVPFCRADPPLGARVNVVGTINVLEAAKRRRDSMAAVVYASSVAALAPDGGLAANPSTLYGGYKRANEAGAAVYFADDGVSSIGLRPHTVYGVGRDQGVTSAPTVAMLAAAAGVPYTIPYGGAGQLQLARDVARAFVGASTSGFEGAAVHGLPSRVTAIEEVVTAIAAVAPGCSIRCEGEPLPFPERAGDDSFAEIVPDYVDTPLGDGVAETIERFRALLSRGLITAPAPVA